METGELVYTEASSDLIDGKNDWPWINNDYK